MLRYGLLLRCVCLTLSLLLAAAVAQAGPVREVSLGVLAIRPKPATLARWQPLADYLSERLSGTRVRLEVLHHQEIDQAVQAGRLDFILTGPGHYIRLKQGNSLSGALATLISAGNGDTVHSIGGVVITRSERSDLREFADLRGKSVAIVDTVATAGYQAPARELVRAGLDLRREVRFLELGGPYDRVVAAVLSGQADAGFVRSGILEHMAEDGLLVLSRLRVLERRTAADFPLILSTELYPEWPFIAVRGVDDELVRNVASALIAIKHGGPLAQSCEIHGFTIPADYSSVESMMRELHLPPFDVAHHPSLADIWHTYRFVILSLSGAVVVIVVMSIWLLVVNRRLAVARKLASASEDRYRRLAENTSDVFWQFELSSNRFNYVSPAITRLTGHIADELVGAGLEKIVAPESLRQVGEWLEQGLREFASGRSDPAGPVREIELLRKEGGTVWVEVSSTYVLDTAGRPVSVNGVSRDISDRRRAEEKRKRALARLQATLQATADGILSVSNDFKVTGFNEQFIKMWKIPSEILEVGDHRKVMEFAVTQVLNPEQYLERVREIYASPESSSFDLVHLKDGRIFERYSQPQAVEGQTIGRVVSFRDVTSRRQAEQVLQESEQRFRAIFNSTGSGIALIGRNMEILDMNPLMHQWFPHIEVGAHPLCYRSFNTPPRETVCDYCPTAKTLADGQNHSAETSTPTPDGVRYYHVVASPLRDSEGEIVAAIEVVQDVTERRRADNEIKRLAQEMQTTLDTLTVGVALIKERRVLWANAALDQLLDCGPKESWGVEMRRLYVDEQDYLRIGDEGYSRLRLGESYVTEVKIRGLDGHEFWCSLSGRAVNPGEPAAGSIWMFQDVTERKTMEAALQERERFLSTIIDSEPECVKLLDSNGALLQMNASGLAMIDAEALEQVQGQCVYPLVVPEHREAFRRLNEEVFQGCSGRLQFEAVGLKGRHIWLETNAVPLRNERDEIVAALAITRDISALRQEEEALRELTRTLERRVEEEIDRRLKNEQMLVQQAKLAAMGEMLGAIAHQWRQPLNALGLCVQNIGNAFAHQELDKAYMDRAVKRSMEQIQHMSKTIDDFRNFFQPDKAPVRFDTMVATGNVLALFSSQLSHHGIGFRLTCHSHDKSLERVDEIIPCPEKTIDGYCNEFEHVMLNLVSNAKDAILAARERDVAAGSAGLPGEIRFDFYNRDGLLVVIEVSDNGQGIPEAILSRIFEPYFTTKDPTKGTGIGLYMSKVIIEEHMHGTLEAENRETGALFRIILPQAKDEGER